MLSYSLDFFFIFFAAFELLGLKIPSGKQKEFKLYWIGKCRGFWLGLGVGVGVPKC
jgi:hypothetical protein